MGEKVVVEIGGKTYTEDNLHELVDDPNVTAAETNIAHGVSGADIEIRADRIEGGLVFGGGDN